MPAKRTTLAGLVPVGFETISLTDGTAIGLNSTNQGASVIKFSVETQAARFRADSTAAALTTGVLLATGNYEWQGISPTFASNLTFQRSTGTCTINVQSFKHPGESR